MPLLGHQALSQVCDCVVTRLFRALLVARNRNPVKFAYKKLGLLITVANSMYHILYVWLVHPLLHLSLTATL